MGKDRLTPAPGMPLAAATGTQKVSGEIRDLWAGAGAMDGLGLRAVKCRFLTLAQHWGWVLTQVRGAL